MYDARLHTDKLPANIVDGLKNFSGNDCYLIKRDVDRKSFLCNKNNCHLNVMKRIEKFGGEMINGWLLSKNKMFLDMGIWVWSYHSVWLTPKGKIVDVTDNEDYKNLPLSTFIPDFNRKIDLENGIAYNTIVIFDNFRVADKLAEASNEDRQLVSGVVYWTTSSVKFFRELDEHSGQYLIFRKEYPQNLKKLEEQYECRVEGNRLIPNNPAVNQMQSNIFFDFSVSGG